MITREGGHLGLGIAVGVFCATLILLVLDAVTLPFVVTDGILGAIVGGLIAGGVAIAGQVMVILAELNVLEKAEKKTSRVAAQGIFLKSLEIHDYTRKAHNYYRTYDETSILAMQSIPSDEARPQTTQLWKPLRSNKKPIHFNDDEKTLSLDSKELQLFNLLNDLEGSFEQLLFIETAYTQKFDQFEQIHIKGNLRSLKGKQVQSMGQVNPLEVMELVDFQVHLRRLLISTLKHVTETTTLISKILSDQHQLTITMADSEDTDGALYNH